MSEVTHARRDATVLQAARGFASAPNSPRVYFLQRSSKIDKPQQTSAAIPELSREVSLEDMTARIGAMFPTAHEFDIQELLRKYHYREAVVISALQVQRHPLTTPGPALGRNSPALPVKRLLMDAWRESPTITTFSETSSFSKNFSVSTPVHSPLPSRPPHSPKIKLRYLKSVFPKTEETLLLDLLSSSDNNVHNVSQKLLGMGHLKKDKPQPLTPRRNLSQPQVKIESSSANLNADQNVKLPSPEEKVLAKTELSKLFPDIGEHLIDMALESANYDLPNATLLLRDLKNSTENQSESSRKEPITISLMKTSPSIISTFKDIVSITTPSMEDKNMELVNPREKPTAQMNYAASSNWKGPDVSLLIKKYENTRGPQGVAKGPDPSNRSERSAGRTERTKPVGPDPSNRNGCSEQLANGSIMSSLKRAIRNQMRNI